MDLQPRIFVNFFFMKKVKTRPVLGQNKLCSYFFDLSFNASFGMTVLISSTSK
jgi:hypothetical protein